VWNTTTDELEVYNGTAWVGQHHSISFVPTWSNLLVGAGSNVGSYQVVGDRCRGEAKLAFGAGYALNASGVLLTPPVTPRAPIVDNMPVGQAMYLDTGTGWISGWVMLNAAGMLELRTHGSPYAGSVNGTGTPVTFAVGDQIAVSFEYWV